MEPALAAVMGETEVSRSVFLVNHDEDAHGSSAIASWRNEMCRYAEHTYNEPFACFGCRKSFKQVSRWRLPENLRPAKGAAREVPCPQCGKLMADMGKDFKAPKQTDVEQWEKIRLLFEAGFTFHSCGCCGPGYRPAELKEIKDFMLSQRTVSEGAQLLERIIQRKAN